MYTTLCIIYTTLLIYTGTIEQGDWKRTIDHYCIIIFEHTMLAACVFFNWGTQNLPYSVSKQDQNYIFPEHMGLYQIENNFNAICK